MRDYLLRTPIAQPTGVAWAYSTLDSTVVTGSTSHAITALVRHGGRDDVIRQGLRYLLAVQEPGGGWAEVPGHRPTIHNTFNAVRAIRTAARAGQLAAPEATSALDRARDWFLHAVGRRPPRSVLDHSFAVRAAIQLDLLMQPRFELLTRQLSRRRRHFLDPAADAYAETAIAALALLESSREVDAAPGKNAGWQWRWQLPTVPPPFLARGAYLYELLYGAVKARWWVRVVDALVDSAVIDRSAGILLGTITALGIVDPDIAQVLVDAQGSRATLTLVGVSVLLLLWLGVKTAARSSLLRSLTSSLGALVSAVALTWVLHTPTPALPALASLIGLRMLVIDVVAFTADSTGLLDRLLPKQ